MPVSIKLYCQAEFWNGAYPVNAVRARYYNGILLSTFRACLIIGYIPLVFSILFKKAILMKGGYIEFWAVRWCTPLMSDFANLNPHLPRYSTVAQLQWWCAVIFCHVSLQFYTCDPRIVTQIKRMTIAQQWEMAAPTTATPPTTCHATVASIRRSPQTPPQGGELPSIAVLVRRSPPKNAGIESVSSIERAPSSCLAPRFNLRRVKYKICTVIST